MFSLKREANHGPNADSVVRLRDCWSIIQLRLNYFSTSKMFLSVESFRWIL